MLEYSISRLQDTNVYKVAFLTFLQEQKTLHMQQYCLALKCKFLVLPIISSGQLKEQVHRQTKVFSTER